MTARVRVESADRAVERVPMHVGGGPWNGEIGGTYEVVDPGRGTILADVQDATEGEVAAAVEAARGVAKQWASLGPSERARRVGAFAHAVAAASDELARLDSRNGGHPLRWTRFGAQKGAETLRYFAGLALEVGGRTVPATTDHLHLTVREPFGVVAVITAYNHPTMFATARTAAPLVAGNAVIVKPAEQTPLSALRLARIADEHLLPGVFSVVTGRSAAGRALVIHPDVPRINFTGSTRTALRIQADAAASGRIKRLGFQLSGKNPLIVMPDVGADEAADAAVEGMNVFKVMGQSCGSTSVAYVHRSRIGAFQAALASRLEAIAPGDPEDERTEVGALISEAHRERVETMVGQAQTEGARLLAGGRRPVEPALANGFFYQPTALSDVDRSMTIVREEIFGPVLAIVEWSSEEELLDQVNASEYGLTAAVYSHDLDAALRMARSVEAGYVWINDVEKRWIGVPFGGYKNSGTSTEFSVDELMANSQVKTISIKVQ
jgi:acyl-CoA reductase-like NAD-dependent aldehyde dehydrogenase